LVEGGVNVFEGIVAEAGRVLDYPVWSVEGYAPKTEDVQADHRDEAFAGSQVEGQPVGQ